MVNVTVSAAGRAPSFAHGLPITIDLPEDDTILDVKKAIQLRFQKVRPVFIAAMGYQER